MSGLDACMFGFFCMQKFHLLDQTNTAKILPSCIRDSIKIFIMNIETNFGVATNTFV